MLSCLFRCHCCPHTIGNDDSIAQRSPKMTVLMLDACTVFVFDELAVGGSGSNHGLDMQPGKKLKEARDYLFARACAPNAEAVDTGKHTTTTGNVLSLRILAYARHTAMPVLMRCARISKLHSPCLLGSVYICAVCFCLP